MPVTDRDIYFFDLQGFLKVPGALSRDEVDALNAAVDEVPRLKAGEWYGGLHGHHYRTQDGINYQQIYELPPFDKLIDHPSWYDKVRKFVGGENGFDDHHGPLFIDEAFINFREPGEAIGLHSGADECNKRCSYRVRDGKFMACQVNMLLALTDIGPGDGGTMVIPCSHKQHFKHPDLEQFRMKAGGASGDGCEGAIEIFMNAGDVLLFTDAICHGSAKRTSEGERRVVVYRYGPSWGMFHLPFRPTHELMSRLTDRQRKIVWPHAPLGRRVPQLRDGFDEIDPNEAPLPGDVNATPWLDPDAPPHE